MKKLSVLLVILSTLLFSFSAYADNSVAVTPKIAIDCLEEVKNNPPRKAGDYFTKYVGSFYIDFNQNSIPELALVYTDSSGWDACVVFYYTRLSFDMSKGLENSTPVYTAEIIYETPTKMWGEGLLSTSIGGSGGTTAEIVRFANGRYGIQATEHGGAGEDVYTCYYDGGEMFWETYEKGEIVWSVSNNLPEENAFYTVPDPNNPFKDVSKNDYYYDSVSWAVKNNITQGTSNTTFSPMDTCTRGQVVTFLHRMNGCPTPSGTNPFSDVAKGAYYYDAVLWAVEAGITQGTSATTFSPDATCTSAQVITFLHRAKGEPAPVSDSGEFTGEYYKNAYLWAKENGFFENIVFSPSATAKRAEIVTYMYTAKDIAVSQKAPDLSDLEDGRYDVYFLRNVKKNGLLEEIDVEIIEYVGVNSEDAYNLKAGDVLNYSQYNPELPDITVETAVVEDKILKVNGTYTFWLHPERNNMKGKFIFSDDEFDSNNVGFTYKVADKTLTIMQGTQIYDYTTASEVIFDSYSELLNKRPYQDKFIGSMDVKDGMITAMILEYRP